MALVIWKCFWYTLGLGFGCTEIPTARTTYLGDQLVASYAASWNALSPAGAGAGTEVGNKAYPVSLEELDKELGCALQK